MDIALPLEKMSVTEKLRALEEIWEDLCRTADNVPSPPWHAELLESREKRIQEGSGHFSDWDKAKRRIREKAE